MDSDNVKYMRLYSQMYQKSLYRQITSPCWILFIH